MKKLIGLICALMMFTSNTYASILTYTDAAESPGNVIKSSHWNDLRNDLQNFLDSNLLDSTNNIAANGVSTTALANLCVTDAKIAGITTAGKVSGSALTSLSTIPANAGVIPAANVPSTPGLTGACHLILSGANLVLMPYNGNTIQIQSAAYTIPAAGTTGLGTGGLGSGTLYYIYAYASSGNVVLYASTQTHATDSTAGNIGVEIMSGNSSYSLVGMAKTTAGTAWVNSATQRFVVSWFNRQNIQMLNTFSTARSTTSNSYTEVNSEIECQFLTWSTEDVWAYLNTGNTNNNSALTAIAFDSTSSAQPGFEQATEGLSSVYNLIAISGRVSLAEGYHYATLLGCSNGSGATLNYPAATVAGANSVAKTYLHVGIRG